MFDAVPFLPIDLKLLPAASTLQGANGRFLRERRPCATVRTHAVGSPKVRRRFSILCGPVHDAPAVRRPLPNLEPGADHTVFAGVEFDKCLEMHGLEYDVPNTERKC